MQESTTHAASWFVATVAIVIVLIGGLAVLERGAPLSVTSPTSAYLNETSGLSTSTNQTDCNQVGPWPSIPMSQQEAVSIARSSPQYRNLTAGAALVNCTGIAFGSNGDGNLQFLAVNFAVQFADLSCNDMVIQVDPYSGLVLGGSMFFSFDAPYGQCG